MSSGEPEPARYSIQLLVPATVTEGLTAWAEAAEGASIPVAGWHITLLPSFAARVDRGKLVELLAAIAANHAPFAVMLDTIEVVPDRTRDGYAAVFLGALRASESNLALHALYADLAASLAPVRRGNHAALETVAFAPHVTLALAVSEQEGERLASSARRAGLALDFLVDALWLVTDETLLTGETYVARDRVAFGATASQSSASASMV